MESRNNRYGWGLIGPGRFAREFVSELRNVPRARLVAVASRSEEKANAFAGEFGFEKAYGTCESLLANPDVQIVYIVVPHVFHSQIAEMAIAAGKSVICEKPLTPSAAATRALTNLARHKKLFLMEAMKTAFLPAIREARRWIDEGCIGEVLLAKADFCFQGSTDPDDRLMNPDLGGGAVPDVGIYPLFLTRYLLGEVIEVNAVGSITRQGVEDTAAILTKHHGGASSVMTCSFRTDEAMDATILGTKGEIRIPKFHAANRAVLLRNGSIVDGYKDERGGMVRAEIEAAHEALDGGLLETTLYSHADSVRLAEIMDEVRLKLGVPPCPSI
jgi:dihydrodiol dehydrogenase / D-xylose 1-dehydrogenase (NADP)